MTQNPFPKTMNVKQAVVSTLAFFDLFKVPLTRTEISEHYFYEKPDEEKIDIYLNESPQISMKDGLYALKKDEAFYKEFEEKQERSKSYWKKVHRHQWLLNICPFIKFIAVCNSLTINDTNPESDIDLFVVTEKNRMFTARFFLTLFTSIFGLRRHGDKIRKRFCLSFYITEDAANFKKIVQKPYDIYLAYWFKTLEPIVGDYNLYKSIIHTNQKWLKPYFHTFNLRRRRYRKAKQWQSKWKIKLEKWFWHSKWEMRFKKHQLERIMRKRSFLEDKSGTIITDSILKFHDKDARHELRKEWEKRIQAYL